MVTRGSRTHLDIAACHEAGHALAVLWQGMRLVGIEVSLGNPGAGRTVYRLPPERNPFDPTRGPGCARAAWEDTVTRTLREARVALAGPLAEARLLDKPLRSLGARGDMEHCRRLVDRLVACREAMSEFCTPPPFDPDAVMNRERTRVRRWLARPETEGVVRRVAGYLSIMPTVFGWDLDAFIGYERARHGQPELPFPSFEDAPKYIALAKQYEEQQGERVAA